MNNNILIGQYVETHSLLHRLDPRTKILAVFLLLLSFIMLNSYIGYTAATVVVTGLIRLSGISFGLFLRGLKPLWFILMFTLVYNALFIQGQVIWSWGIIGVTSEGLQTGIQFVWRIVLLVWLSSLLTLTTQPLVLAQGLTKLMAPLSRLHVPVEQFSLMIVIAIRFIPTIMQELDRILLAQKARGYDLAALPLPKRMVAYIPVIVPLLFTVIGRAEQLSHAIDARAFGKGKGRTEYRQLHLQRIDYQAGGTVVVIAAVLLLLQSAGI
ncbi:energy-coupling factor transporter transmembrane protein EcfT [Paenibacillus sp. PK3_47]|uniref:energy-coupling factor transporter transmembrane component T family protein n=1 Tax=Paenibacillus sp. PK3_47 TaxID=2072642 RepID=UPI00201E6294|nr:energy-coupling factor transporter transmembrane component T [Paenibacillus sp. PK3_47]UQZ32213.1 energy-coupling factor transporter transmembrane protein EcfT [Paenibacillus sp. PK3_47]